MRLPLPCVAFLWLPSASACASGATCSAEADVIADDVHISLLQKSFSVASGELAFKHNGSLEAPERTDSAAATDDTGPRDETKGARPKEANTTKTKNKLGPEYTISKELPTWSLVLIGVAVCICVCSFTAMLYICANRVFGNRREAHSPVALKETDEATLLQMCMAEAAGTFLNVLGGTSVGSADKYLHCGLGLLGQSIAWGVSVALSIFASRQVSGGHCNPACTVSMWFHNGFPLFRVPFFIGAQLLGGTLASSLVYMMFSGGIEALEMELKLPRGTSTATFAGAFGLVPGPAWLTPGAAFGVEFVATTFLIFIVFTVTDWQGPVPKNAQPILIGTAVALMIAAFGALDGAGMNPARDTGPRIVTYFAGWGEISFSYWWCYTLGPILGGINGGWLYNRFFKNLSHK